jgi:hypothetical protein
MLDANLMSFHGLLFSNAQYCLLFMNHIKLLKCGLIVKFELAR